MGNTLAHTTEKVQSNTVHYFVGMRKPGTKADATLFCIGKSFSEITDESPVKGFWVNPETLKANNGALGRLIVAQVNKILNN